MRYFAFILGALLNLSGIVGLVAVYRQFSFQQFVIGMSLIVIGILTMMAAKIRYKGGLLSIIGVVFLFFGLIAVSIEIDSIIGSAQRSVYSGLVLGIILILAGILLLRQGHRRHLRLVKQGYGNKSQNNRI
jgi:uncharacterized membrane protein YidH (DUF202 family)